MNTHRSFRLTRTASQAVSGRLSITFPVMQQCVILVLAAMILDGGECLQICGYAAVAYWCGFGLIMAQRHGRLTGTDKILMRWGFLMLERFKKFCSHSEPGILTLGGALAKESRPVRDD